ncbi:MAG: hypothetical protein EOP56_14265 [Sphingobacteriales bacterium]|nr:MAG: hypothetical protein EOP56_14265 [Sphingobacteriales bacterium]
MANESNIIAFRYEYLIVSEGKHIGKGAQTMYSTDPEDTGRDRLKAEVMEQLEEKHPDTPFMVIIQSSKVMKEQDTRNLPNGFKLTETI